MKAPAETLALLRRVPLFAELGEEEVLRLAELCVEEHVAANQRVFSHGESANFFYIIQEGSVTLFRDEVGRPVQVQTRLGPGDYFGEIGLFDGYKRSGSARTGGNCRLLRIAKSELLHFLDRHPSIAIKLQVAAARRHSENVVMALNLGVRGEVRIRLDKKVTLELPFGLRHRAQVENLSLGGMCLRSAPTSWQKGREVRFTLIYQEEILPVDARISWREEDTAGLAFLAAGEEHDDRVQRLLRRLLD
jgi:CRP-like cAMP-binding protein